MPDSPRRLRGAGRPVHLGHWVELAGLRRPPLGCATDVAVTEAVREYALDRFARVLEEIRATGQANAAAVDGWRSMLSAGRMRSVLTLARGIVARKADDLDSDPDLLNTPAGVVDLPT